jgi:hypothetical protein
MKLSSVFNPSEGASLLYPTGPLPPTHIMDGLVSTDRAAREEIQHRAYAIWMSEGEPQNRGLDHWLQAESEVIRGT